MPSKVIAEGVSLFSRKLEKRNLVINKEVHFFLPSSDLSQKGRDLAERASIWELEQQDLEKLTVFSTNSFTTTSLHALSPEDVESRPNPITLKT
ncbi:hypothetical protein F8M41_011762 [Gigaspora margarita]|uniref:Uncharacterized protein n=1 Tax=Gigaspora margarita TaxID=4874 RepID=A0A8H4ATI8_GIGMA|nr:hypothetical protein F8M41_011762 [Gigaspora margarita]